MDADETAAIRRTATAMTALFALYDETGFRCAVDGGSGDGDGDGGSGGDSAAAAAATAGVDLSPFVHVSPADRTRISSLLSLISSTTTTTTTTATPPLHTPQPSSSCSAGLFVGAFVPSVPNAMLRPDLPDTDACAIGAHLFAAAVLSPFGNHRGLEAMLSRGVVAAQSLTRVLGAWLLSLPPAVLVQQHVLEYLPELLTRVLLGGGGDGVGDGVGEGSGALVAALIQQCVDSSNTASALVVALALSHAKYHSASSHACLPQQLEAITAINFVRAIHCSGGVTGSAGAAASASASASASAGGVAGVVAGGLSLTQAPLIGEALAALLVDLDLSPEQCTPLTSTTTTTTTTTTSTTTPTTAADSEATALLARHCVGVYGSDLLWARVSMLHYERWHLALAPSQTPTSPTLPPTAVLRRLTHAQGFNALVQGPVLRHGVALMAWQRVLQPKCAVLAGLVGKVGKRPKDRLCAKHADIEGTDAVVAVLAAGIASLRILGAPRVGDISPSRDFGPDVQQLATLQIALSAGPALESTLLLLQIVELVFRLDLRSVRLVALFPPGMQSLFFTSLTSAENTPPHDYVLETLIGGMAADNISLASSITTTTTTATAITATTDDPAAVCAAFFSQALARTVCEAPAHAEALFALATGAPFNVPPTPLRVQHVLNMQERALDADEARLLVPERERAVLAKGTLAVARRLVARFVAAQNSSHPERKGEAMAHLTIDMHDWLESAPTTISLGQCPVVVPQLTVVRAMLQWAAIALPAGSPDAIRARQLDECVNALQGTYETQ